MLEMSLKDIINKMPFALTKAMRDEFISLGKEVNENTPSPEVAFDIIEKLFEADLFSSIFDEDKDGLLKNLRNVSEVYGCYLAMEYIYQVKNPNGIQLNYKGIETIFKCKDDDKSEIYNRLKRKIKVFPELYSYPDPKFFNPYVVNKYEEFFEMLEKKKHKKERAPKVYPHIYNGDIIYFLKRNVICKENKIYINTISPSVFFIVLTSLGYQPNGGSANKSKDKITVRAINAVDDKLHGELIYKSNEKEYKAFQDDLLLKSEISDSTKRVINTALVEDIFKMERLDRALQCYDDYIEEKNIYSLNDKKEKAIASIFSLLTVIPKPFLNRYEDKAIKAADSYLEENSEKYHKFIREIFLFTSFILPVTVALFCHLLFKKYVDRKDEKCIEDMESVIDRLVECIEKNKDIDVKFSVGDNRIWNSEKVRVTLRNKGVKKETGFKQECTETNWKNVHLIGLEDTIGIMLNQCSNPAKSRILFDENYALPEFVIRMDNSIRQQLENSDDFDVEYKMKKNELARLLACHRNFLKQYEPLEYAEKLTDGFINDNKFVRKR